MFIFKDSIKIIWYAILFFYIFFDTLFQSTIYIIFSVITNQPILYIIFNIYLLTKLNRLKFKCHSIFDCQLPSSSRLQKNLHFFPIATQSGTKQASVYLQKQLPALDSSTIQSSVMKFSLLSNGVDISIKFSDFMQSLRVSSRNKSHVYIDDP